MDIEPPKAPVFNANQRATSVVGPAPLTRRSWGVVVLVGVPLLAVLFAGLTVVHHAEGGYLVGASIFASLVAGRVAGIHGARRWFLAWLLLFSIFYLMILLYAFVGVAFWGFAPF